MSLIHTESFGIFKRFTGTDAQAVVAAEQPKLLAMFTKAGYGYTTSTPSSAWVVRDDPLEPSGAALVFAAATSTTGSAVAARLNIPIPSQPYPVIIGFSIYIPAEFATVPATASVVFSLTAGAAQTTLVSIRQSLQVANGSDLQSPRTLTPGRLNFFEIRIRPAGYQVWIDDALVYESTVQIPKESIGLNMFRLAGLAANTLNWAFSNLYILSQDGIAPSERLGPTTRVIAASPASDVSVEFIRPIAAPTNASVVAQVVDELNPTLTLQAEGVGARDEYGFTESPAISGAAMVHGITTKVMTANLESAKHAIRPFVSGGNIDGADENYYISEIANVVEGRTLTSSCVRGDGTIFVCGTGPGVWYSVDGGDTWAVGYDGGGAVIANDIACGPDGTVIACCNGGQFLTCQGTDGPTVWTFAMSPASGFNLQSIAVSPTGTWVCGHLGGNAQQLVKFGAATWTLQTRANALWMGYTGDAFYFNTNATSAWRSVDAAAWTALSPNPPSAVGTKFPIVVRDGVLHRYYLRTTNRITAYRYTGTAWVGEVVTHLISVGSDSLGVEGAAYDEVNDLILLTAPSVCCILPPGDNINAIYIYPPTPSYIGILYGTPCVIPKGFIAPMASTSGAFQGKVLLVRKRKSTRPLVMSDGYVLLANSAAVNPDTGLPWTGPEADSSTAGMTVIS